MDEYERMHRKNRSRKPAARGGRKQTHQLSEATNVFRDISIGQLSFYGRRSAHRALPVKMGLKEICRIDRRISRRLQKRYMLLSPMARACRCAASSRAEAKGLQLQQVKNPARPLPEKMSRRILTGKITTCDGFETTGLSKPERRSPAPISRRQPGTIERAGKEQEEIELVLPNFMKTTSIDVFVEIPGVPTEAAGKVSLHYRRSGRNHRNCGESEARGVS
jgi:hypothetical protein